MASGEISSGRKAKRHPLDWYVEQGWEWRQVMQAIGLREQENGSAIWDPACGFGTSGVWLQDEGFNGQLLLSDLVNNLRIENFADADAVHWKGVDFIDDEEVGDFMGDWPSFALDRLSIWSNPPYSYKKVWFDGRKVSISEAFVRQALKLATDRVVMILPHKWLAMGKRRSLLVRRDHPPQYVLHFCERPSMPPGDMIAAMGDRAFRGGMIDYCAVVWDVRNPTAPGETRTIWLPPLSGAR